MRNTAFFKRSDASVLIWISIFILRNTLLSTNSAELFDSWLISWILLGKISCSHDFICSCLWIDCMLVILRYLFSMNLLISLGSWIVFRLIDKWWKFLLRLNSICLSLMINLYSLNFLLFFWTLSVFRVYFRLISREDRWLRRFLKYCIDFVTKIELTSLLYR